MGFMQPTLPTSTRHLADHWAGWSGSGSWPRSGSTTASAPSGWCTCCTCVKCVLYAGGAILVASLTTPGLGGGHEVGHWWTEPIFFQKAVVFTLLFEILGLGCGSGPLTLRITPPIGGVLYWLRPGRYGCRRGRPGAAHPRHPRTVGRRPALRRRPGRRRSGCWLPGDGPIAPG